MANLLEQLDDQIALVLSGWSIYTSILAVVLVAFIGYPLLFGDEPDTHPLLLARQSAPSPIRHSGESATYRSVEVPHGYPLRTGLNVKEPGAPKWTAGRDGDIRDIWREASRADGAASAALIMSVYGKDAAIDHDVADISKAINIIGKHLQLAGCKRVAIYLPNCIEYIIAIFACAFYGQTPVLIPYNQPQEAVFDLLNASGADCLIAGAGSLPLTDLCGAARKLHQMLWVVEPSSRQMDWGGAPDELNGAISVSVWHELVEESQSHATSVLPENDDATMPGNIAFVWQKASGGPADITEFTQRNMVSAIGALISCLPNSQRFSASDLVLPADLFSNSYVLCLTFAALYSHASLAINSVAGPGVDLSMASRSVSPTVVIASAETLANLHEAEMAGVTSGIRRVAHVSQAQAMSAGRMPTDNLLFRLMAPRGNAIGNNPGTLRLIFTSDKALAGTPALSSTALSDLRVLLQARICYALTAAQVAGAIAQTNMYDYRRDDGTGHSHFGAPLSSIELKLIAKDDAMVDGGTPVGEIFVSGPSVAGGRATLGVQGKIRQDCTLAYA